MHAGGVALLQCLRSADKRRKVQRAGSISEHANVAPRAQMCAAITLESSRHRVKSSPTRCASPLLFTTRNHHQKPPPKSSGMYGPPRLVKHPAKHIAAFQHALHTTLRIVVQARAFVMLLRARFAFSSIARATCHLIDLIDGHQQLTARFCSHYTATTTT